MNPVFTIFTCHDEAVYKALVGAFYVRRQPVIPVAYTYVFAALIAGCIACSIFPFSQTGVIYWAARIGLVLLTVLLVKPYRKWSRTRNINKITRQIMEKAPDVNQYVIYDFFEDHITIISDGKKGDVDYMEITELLDSGEHYQLFFGEGTCHVMGKDDFKSGSSEEFPEFIRRKSGKSVQIVRY